MIFWRISPALPTNPSCCSSSCLPPASPQTRISIPSGKVGGTVHIQPKLDAKSTTCCSSELSCRIKQYQIQSTLHEFVNFYNYPNSLNYLYCLRIHHAYEFRAYE